MNIHMLNRILVILFSVLTVVFWAGLVFAVWAYPRPLGSNLRQIGTTLSSVDPVFQVVVTLVGLAVILVAFLILLSEFMPETAAVVRLNDVNGGHVVIATESLAQIVKHEAERVPEVLYARPRVTSLGNRADVVVELRTDPRAHAPSAVEAACQAIREALEQRTGVKIRNLTVRLRNEPNGMGSRPVPLPRAADTTHDPAITVPAGGVPPAVAGLAASESGEGRPAREDDSRL